MKFYVVTFSIVGENDWAYVDPDNYDFDTYKEALDYICKCMEEDEKAGNLGRFDYKISEKEE